MAKKVLVRDGRHMRPMLAVLTRNGIGDVDQYGRGRWIAETDIPRIADAIRSHPRAIRGGAAEDSWLCPGTNIHNWVDVADFKALFK